MHMMDKVSRVLQTMTLLDTSNYDRPQLTPSKRCTRAKYNTLKYGKKCKHGGSCDGYKRCKFATY